ncbi:hypothetical protein CBM2599_B50989 [Cupriavidus taiwanensis]|nr:hypothetical protein CBM2600_B10001 [Cupriavidus taiwanensis]SOY97243.1 hypothetical protein CBM2599_B50989 [Cupriavidus taiwanensis]
MCGKFLFVRILPLPIGKTCSSHLAHKPAVSSLYQRAMEYGMQFLWPQLLWLLCFLPLLAGAYVYLIAPRKKASSVVCQSCSAARRVGA